MHPLIKPPLLEPGDRVVIIAPAGYVEKGYIELSKQVFESWGLEVVFGGNLFERHFQFAGTDAQRLSDLQDALDDKNVKGIICARGGYGTVRILDKLNWNGYKENPKWVVGFSDITALHAKLQNLGYQSIHGAMPINFTGLNAESPPLALLKQCLFKGILEYKLAANTNNWPGSSEAPLVGGNLTLLNVLAASPYKFDSKGKTLFIEEVGEANYHIDRMLQGMRLAGFFEDLTGMVIGSFTDISDDKRPFGMDYKQIIRDCLGEPTYPVVFDFPAGHRKDNRPIFFGANTILEANQGHVSITQT